MEKQNSEDSIHENIKKLTRGLVQSAYPIAYEGYKNLYEVGKPVIPLIRDLILEIDWSNKKFTELTLYVSGFFSLLHDLDEQEAHFVRKKLVANGCPKHIDAILNSICSFSLSNYDKYQIRGIDIFEHISIEAKCSIRSYLDRWLENVPHSDLAEINRIFVTSRDKIEAAGTYTPILNVIALLWDINSNEGSIIFKLHGLWTEKVFYHEIGHHIHRHSFGTVPEQEKEADSYAFKIMKKTHPILTVFLTFLSLLGLKSRKSYYRWGL